MIEQGKIINRRDLRFYPYIIRALDSADLPQIMDLQNFVVSFMKDKSYCFALTPEEHYEIINGNGESIGLFVQGKLYAVCSILFPGHREDNMARELDFDNQELQHVAQLELSMVHPDLRGNSLQNKLANMIARRAKKKKNYKYLFTTVSPYNYPSIKTVTSMGLNIAKLCKMYHQWDRYVVYKDLVNPLELDKSSAIHVPGGFFKKQQDLLSSGYFGFSQFKDEEGIKILFARRLNSYHTGFSKMEGLNKWPK